MTHRLIIPGRLAGINEYTYESRRSPYAGAELKRRDQHTCEVAILDCLRGVKIENPVHVSFEFYEKNKRRDLDNISGWAHKVIFDALVNCGVLADDGWDEINGFDDEFFVDSKNPRIEVFINEQQQ